MHDKKETSRGDPKPKNVLKNMKPTRAKRPKAVVISLAEERLKRERKAA